MEVTHSFLFMKLKCKPKNLLVIFYLVFSLSPKVARDGGWTDWSDWSCNSKCKNSRTRNCTNPLPFFGGLNCTGDDYEELEPFCYGNDCCPGKHHKKTLIGKSQFLDTSDYIGCYAKEEGLTSNRISKTLMTNCYCVGYCRSLNFSLAGLYQ